MDIQGMDIDPALLKPFELLAEGRPFALPNEADALRGEALRTKAREVIARLAVSTRPCVMPGTGVRVSGCVDRFLKIAERIGAPIATAFNAHDLVPDDHPLYVGRPGTVGDRAGNFAVQNADFLLVLGCRLNIRQISYNWGAFARGAYKVMVDVDRAELEKPTLSIDLPVHADLGAFFDALEIELANYSPPAPHRAYLGWCAVRRERYPTILPSYWERTDSVNPYCFGGALFDALDNDDVVVTGDGTACVVTFQSARIKRGQRLFSNSGSASMGYDLPAAIGAVYARGGAQRVVCLAGDGSLMMNLQELQSIVGQSLPIKLFVLNNNGYHSIRQTQSNYFPDNPVGCGPESGLTFPDFSKLATGFGLTSFRISNHGELRDGIAWALATPGPVLVEVMLDKSQEFSPKSSSRRLADGRMVSSPLEDLAPFLSRDELRDNMLVPMLAE